MQRVIISVGLTLFLLGLFGCKMKESKKEVTGNQSINKDALKNELISFDLPTEEVYGYTTYIELRDNCIIDYKPTKPLLDAIRAGRGNESGQERYDYYKNPVNITYSGKTIKFPYLTVYYKYQAYAEAVPLLKALGGCAKYNRRTGTMTCNYGGNVLIMKDFSNKVTLNGEKISLEYPLLGLNYDVVKTRKVYRDCKCIANAPKVVEISEEQTK